MSEAAAWPWQASYPEGIAWDTPFPEQPVGRFLDEAVAQFGDCWCLEFLGRRWRYAEVGSLVARATKGLQALGVAKGSRVGLFLPNTPYYVICYQAVLKAGGIVVNFNPLYVEAELRHLLADSDVEIMVTLDLAATYPVLARLLGTTPLRTIVVCPMADILPLPKAVLFRLLRRRDVAAHPRDPRHCDFATLIDNDGRPEPVAIEPRRDVAVLQYTGGTTGTPKAAMLTHFNLVANALQCARWFPGARRGGERVLAVLPFFHVFAMTVAMNLSLANAAEIVMLPRFELKGLLRTIDRTRPTTFPGVPTLFAAINAYAGLARHDLTSIRSCISGGAPLPVEVKAAFEARSGCVVVEGYGLTEASPVVCCNPLSGINKPGSIGLPVPGTVVEVVSPDDPRHPVPRGERGELVVSGPQVMAGYWQKPAETALVLEDGRLRTGDVGIMDEDGYFYLVDRIKDVIIAGGYKIYPRLVEDALYQHPKVAECIVAGVPDAYRGQTVKAFVVAAAGATLEEDELRRFLAERLSPIETPKLFEFRTSLPKTPVGKLSKKALIEEEARRAAGAAPGA